MYHIFLEKKDINVTFRKVCVTNHANSFNMPPLCQKALLNSLTLILTGSTINSGRL